MGKYCNFTEVSRILNPPLLSNFSQRQQDSCEDIYLSRKTEPLGRAPLPQIPHRARKSRFGIVTNQGDTGDAVYSFPAESYHSIYTESFDPFKKCNVKMKPAGVKLESRDNSGQNMKDLYVGDEGKSAIIVPRLHAKRENDKQLISTLRNKEENESSKPKPLFLDKDKTCSNIDVVKFEPKRFEKERNLIEVVWNLIKKKNHSNFEDLVSAFKSYQGNTDKITVFDLYKMCQKFGISVPLHIVEKLLNECDIIDKDGTISYQEFVHCLNWKNMLPERPIAKSSKYANDWTEGINNPSEDVIDHFRTTSSFIGDHKYSVPSRGAGLPSLRKDLLKPKVKRVTDYFDYGDEADRSTLIQPDTFSRYGVTEVDLSKLKPKQERPVFSTKEILSIHSCRTI